MSLPGAIAAFLRAPARRKGLALEAFAELARARVLTFLPAHIYTAQLGIMSDATSVDRTEDAEFPNAVRAAEVGCMVESVARSAPFRALCLQQAIAVRRMLARRGMRATVLLGVSRMAVDRAEPRKGTAAHAWVKVGAKVINGDGNLAKYTVVARFN